MRIKLFTIPVGDSGSALAEMNTFLRGNKILEVENHLVHNEHGAYWCFCVRYIERAYPEADGKKAAKVDYRSVLDEATFQKFSKLREIRKKVAAEEGISAFIIFTDDELAELAKLDEITEQAMLGIKGIGEKKTERFAKYFITKPDCVIRLLNLQGLVNV
ncbi:MAG: helicase [Bacteroidetes bacterium]|nr:MAG: helicase [Bacteroidota bacterium]PTM15055.1 MAG: helicase [Bacteroidota bacterium]